MNTKHTPGPWVVRVYAHTDDDMAEMEKLGIRPVRMLTNDGCVPVMSADYRVALVDCQADYKRGQGYRAECAERDANAVLIAAAPELLAALQSVMGFINTDSRFDEFTEMQTARAAIAKATGEA
jgi:hypothetical protein